jgi:hypothetical protein
MFGKRCQRSGQLGKIAGAVNGVFMPRDRLAFATGQGFSGTGMATRREQIEDFIFNREPVGDTPDRCVGRRIVTHAQTPQQRRLNVHHKHAASLI